MKVIILNYCTLDIEIVYVSDELVADENGYTNEGLERFLSEELNYHLDEINYMVADDDDSVCVREVYPDEHIIENV